MVSQLDPHQQEAHMTDPDALGSATSEDKSISQEQRDMPARQRVFKYQSKFNRPYAEG